MPTAVEGGLHGSWMGEGGGHAVPTVAAVQELGEVHGAAGGPGQCLVQVDEQWRHHVVFAHGPKEPCAGLRVVVWHAEHVSWGGGRAWSLLPKPTIPSPACPVPPRAPQVASSGDATLTSQGSPWLSSLGSSHR